MAGPATPNQGLLTWRFAGAAMPFGAQTSLGVEGPNSALTAPETLDEIVLASATFHEAMAVIDCQLTTVDLKIGPEATGPTLSAVVGQNGGEGNDATPPNTAFLIRKTISGISNRFSGRLYWPGVSDGNLMQGGNIDPTAYPTYRQACVDFFDALDAIAGINPVVFNDSSDPRVVSGLDLQLRVATQRRRLRR